MAGEGGTLSFSVASVVEDVLQQHGNRLGDLDLESRKAGEAASRRYEAAGWLRKMVGVVAAKDLPAEPSEEEFRLGLRSGIILCNALNKIQPGGVPKVVESPCDAALIPDGAALSAFQYFENVRNFLVAVQEMGIPNFEASDLEQGGKSARVVNTVLALKSYSEWKQTGGNGIWKFGGNVKPTVSAKSFVRKNSEPFTNSLSRNLSINGKSFNSLSSDLEYSNKMSGSGSLSMLVRAVLLDKNPEEVPMLVESVLSKVVEEFENRIASRHDMVKEAPKEIAISQGKQTEDKNVRVIKKEECFHKNQIAEEELKDKTQKQLVIFDQQQRDIQELKNTLRTTKAGMQFMQMKFHEEFNNLGMHIHSLAHAASGYHKVLEENRKLYNQVQDLKGSIRVYCRVRPFLSGQSNNLSTVDNIEDGNITISTASRHGKGCKSFSFNKTGPKDLSEKNKGVNYRALGDLFLLAEQRKDIFCYNVAVQMIEIYNEQVRDLLVTDGKIRNSSQTGLNVPDANIIPVSSTDDVIDLMNLGQRNRVVGATALNDRSSRSHSCLTVHVQGRDLASGATLRGCMHLLWVMSLLHLPKRIHMYLTEIAKLTQLLQDSLGGQAKTLMFVHISPEPDALGETISTLKFAERVATVELGAAQVNKGSADVKELKEQIASQKTALARKERETEHRRKESESSPFNSNHRLRDAGDSNLFRQPMGDVGNIEVHKSTLRQKSQSFDLDEILANSPPWPPVTSPILNEDEKEMASGEWVDKVMVNKQDAANIAEKSLGCWEAENGNLSDAFHHKYLPDSSKIFPEQSYNMLGSNNQFNLANNDDMDDTDAATSDSSEPDFLWQLNQSKFTSMTNGIESKTRKAISKASKIPGFSKSLHPSQGPSPSRKLANGVGVPLQRNRRQAGPPDGKRKIAIRK
ncbi:KINESIN-LIKE PROTEIN KLP-3 [Salix purpurea]|uniref:KINESIN-LIKE PROTEIN KLP-3 n=1 Tax=Salix purpurea TaxID=77065 RepID=A0A9Q0P212_SALPP|nr:KINESIN-LIKE PROTEIN KLP-3 [Salix purpurea]